MPVQTKAKKGPAVSAFMMLDVDEPSDEVKTFLGLF